MRRYWMGLGGLAAAGALAFMAAGARSEEAKEARAATVKHLMSGVNQPAMVALSKVGRQAPVSDKDWAGLEAQAGLLNEMGFCLMEAGRCPDDVWAKSSADLRAASAAAVEAARTKNLETLKAQIPKLGASCKACHEVHRKAAKE